MQSKYPPVKRFRRNLWLLPKPRILSCLFAAAFICDARAVSVIWSGGSATDGNWSDGSDWTGGTPPGSTSSTTNTDIAWWNGPIANTWGDSAANPVVIDSTTQNIGGINFDTAAGNYFIGSTVGNALLMSSGGTIQILSTLTATNAIETINASLQIQGASGTYTLANNSANGAGAGAGTLKIGGGVAGGAAGTTVLTLSGSNTNANTVSGIIANGSATALDLTKTGTGTWILSGANTYTGGTTVSAGTLDWLNTNAEPASGATTVASGATLGLGVATSGSFFTSANITSLFAGTLANVTNSATSNVGIDTTDGSFAYASSIPNTTRGLAKLGANTLTLTGSNAYTGPTTVSAGTLTAGVASVANTSGAFGNNSAVIMANVSGAILNITGFNTQIGSLTGGGSTGGNVTLGAATLTVGGDNTSPAAYAGAISGTGGALVKIGTGMLTLSGANTYTGGTTVSVGTLDWLDTTAKPASGATTVAAGATLGLGVNTSGSFFTSANVDSLFAGTLANVTNNATSNVGIDTTAGNFTYASNVPNTTRGLTKLGANTLTLTGTNSYTGPTTVSAGALQAGSANAFGNGSAVTLANVASASLDLNSFNNTIGSLSGGGTTGGNVTIESATLTIAGTGATPAAYAGGITDGGLGGTLIVDGPTASAAQMTLGNGGSISVSYEYIGYSTTGSGSFTQSGGTNTAGEFELNASPTNMPGGNGTYTLSGGTLQTFAVIGSTLGTSTFNFNGGTLQANSNVSGFMGDLTAAKVQAGGAIIDTQTYSIGIPQALIHDSALGATPDGGLTKIGAGVLMLSGANTYTGGTTVSAGTLDWLNTSAQPASGTTTVASGATLALGVGTSAGFFTSANVDSLFAGTMANVSNSATSNVGIDTTAGNFTYASSVPSTTRGLVVLGLNQSGNSVNTALFLSGTNSYTGGTTVIAGTLDWLNTHAQPASGTTTVAAGATLALGVATSGNFFTSANVDALFAGTLTGVTNSAYSNVGIDTTAGNFAYATSQTTGIGLVKLGANTLTYSGTYEQSAGTFPTVTVIAGTLALTGTIEYSGNALTVDGPAANAAQMTLLSGGTLNVAGVEAGVSGTGSFTQSGGAAISSAGLYLGINSGSTGSYTLSGTGTLSTSFELVGEGGTGNFNQNGGTNTATYIQISNDSPGSNGAYTLSGGTLAIAYYVYGGTGVSTFNFNGGTLEATSTETGSYFMYGLTAANVQAGGASIDTQTYSIVITQPLIHESALGTTLDGGLTKTGTGTMTLSGANTYTGPTTVDAGTLQAGVVSVANVSGAFGNNSAVIMANVSGAILNITGFNTQIGSLTGGGSTGGNVTLGAATLTVGGDNTSPAAYAGAISGTGGALAKIGTGMLTLSGANAYTGGTTVSAGTLDWLNTGAKPASGATTVASGATLGLGVATSGSFFTSANVDALFAGTLANVTNNATSNVGIDTTAGNFTYGSNVPSTTRGLTKLGANTLTLTGTDSFTGATTVNAGTVLVSGSISGSTSTVNSSGILGGSGGTTGAVTVNSGGTLAPGGSTAVGTLHSGALTLNGTATYHLELNTATDAASKDIATGNLSLASGDTVALSLTDFGASTTLAPGTVFPFIDYSGTWNGNTFASLPNLSTFTFGSNRYEITYNGVDTGNSSPAVTLTAMAVPEPGCGGLVGLGAVLLALRRRRRRRHSKERNRGSRGDARIKTL